MKLVTFYLTYSPAWVDLKICIYLRNEEKQNTLLTMHTQIRKDEKGNGNLLPNAANRLSVETDFWIIEDEGISIVGKSTSLGLELLRVGVMNEMKKAKDMTDKPDKNWKYRKRERNKALYIAAEPDFQITDGEW